MSVEHIAMESLGADEFIDMVLGLVPDAAVIVDGDGTVIAHNQNLAEQFGYDTGELVGQPIEVLVPERFRHRHRGQRAGFLADPRVRAMGAGLDLYGRRRDGSEFPVDISLAPIAAADRVLVVAAIRDISDRRATEAAHAQLAAIVRSSLDAILAITVDGRVSSWNPGAEHTLGYEAGEVIDTHISRLVPPDASASFEEQLDMAQRGEPVPPTDTEWLTRSGARLAVSVSVAPMVDTAGHLTGFSVLLRDITDAKAAERELRRLLSVSERQARWQEASAEIRLAALDGDPLERILQLVVERTAELMGSSGALVVRDGVVVAATGGAEVWRATAVDVPVSGVEKVVVVAGDELVPPFDGLRGGPVLVAPIGGAGARAALVCDASTVGVDDAIPVVAGLADHAAVAIELERARTDRERLLLADERERIARDLHDHAVQALFATGLSLQSVAPLVENQRAVERIHEAIDSLDATIKQIRAAIFTLSAPPSPGAGLRADVVRLAAEAARSLGFEPAVSFDGPIDNAVSGEVAANVVAVVRESLSNVARHARAHRCTVELGATSREVRVCITDDGVGFAEPRVGNGLGNLRARARGLGGDLDVTSAPGQGTRLRWSVPLG